VINTIHRLPDKSSSADPVPTSVLKEIADIIGPFIAELFNCSLHKGLFPAHFKEAFRSIKSYYTSSKEART